LVTVGEAIRQYGEAAGPKRAAIVRRFVEAQGWHENAGRALAEYLRDLEAQGMKPGTVDQVYRTVRAFYRRLGLEPPRVPGHRYDPQDSSRPALDGEAISRLIGAARSGLVLPQHVGYLALSTVYGLRATEMASVLDQDVDRDGERIYIRTAKGGTARWTWLPPEVARVLPEHWPMAEESHVEASFGRIWDVAMDAEKPRGVAWHAVRRALVRDLRGAGVDASDVERFLRWSSGGSKRMVSLYERPNELVGVSGEKEKVVVAEGTREADSDVWAKHPYISLWAIQ